MVLNLLVKVCISFYSSGGGGGGGGGGRGGLYLFLHAQAWAQPLLFTPEKDQEYQAP